jgi:hypothetical protein
MAPSLKMAEVLTLREIIERDNGTIFSEPVILGILFGIFCVIGLACLIGVGCSKDPHEKGIPL